MTISDLHEQTSKLVSRGLGSRPVMVSGAEDEDGTNCRPAVARVVTVQEMDGPRRRVLMLNQETP